ncbi:hypothetical protein BraRD5C2_39470 [Bradyrhizobium sp. RD5-C2]|nr:hypothetical protein BraRD5C2_39470 [Bradyrhizobium sp. RD5-C2]
MVVKKRDAQPAQKRKREPVDVGMNDVKFARLLCNSFEQHGERGAGIVVLPPEAQRRRKPPRAELCFGIADRKQGHVVAEIDEFIYKPSHDPLSPAVKFGWDALGKRSKLGYPHRISSLHSPKTNKYGGRRE